MNMETIFKEKDLVKLKNGQKFQVVKAINIDEIDYYLLVQINKDADYKNPTFVMAKENIIEDKMFIKILKDEEEIEKVLPYFKDAMKQQEIKEDEKEDDCF